ncbi:MAG: rod shape-determining protein MreD [Clostridia bacterium]|nr:rod shape-determining protein MreD [Clostridia bacterium]
MIRNNRQNPYGSVDRTRTGWRRIVNYLIGLLVTVLAAAIQTSFNPRFPFFGVTTDFLLALCLAVAYFGNDRQGMLLGIMAGFLADVLSGAGISLLALFYPLVAAFFGSGKEDKQAQKRIVPLMKYATIACGARVILTMFLHIVQKQFSFMHTVVRTMIPEMIGTWLLCLVTALVFIGCRAIYDRVV